MLELVVAVPVEDILKAPCEETMVQLGPWNTAWSLDPGDPKNAMLPSITVLEAPKTAGSSVSFRTFVFWLQEGHEPCLQTLEVSKSPLNKRVEDLLLPLAATRLISLAADGCGLTGKVPSLVGMKGTVDGVSYTSWRSFLADSLQLISLSENHIQSCDGLPPSCRDLRLASNTEVLELAPGLIREAVANDISLDLRSTSIRSHEEAEELLTSDSPVSKLHQTNTTVEADVASGFACFGVTSSSLQVSPSRFFPTLCACIEGFDSWNATTRRCQKCNLHFYSDGFNKSCQQCPANSYTVYEGAISPHECHCRFGDLGTSQGGGYACGCKLGFALLGGRPGH